MAETAQEYIARRKAEKAAQAPQAPQAQPFAQFGGSQQAQQARTGMLGALQQQLAQPTRFDTQAFQQIRQAQASQLGAEYQAEQSRLNEELARRGLSASSIGGGRMGDLAGQQARALAQLDAQLLQQAAQTQAQDRLAALQAGAQFAELAGSQDLAQFEANRVAQAAEFQQALQQAQFGQAQTAAAHFKKGSAMPMDYVFPFQIEAMDALKAAMADHSYHLQYLLYADDVLDASYGPATGDYWHVRVPWSIASTATNGWPATLERIASGVAPVARAH